MFPPAEDSFDGSVFVSPQKPDHHNVTLTLNQLQLNSQSLGLLLELLGTISVMKVLGNKMCPCPDSSGVADNSATGLLLNLAVARNTHLNGV